MLHYFQLKKRGLLGKSEAEIEHETINELENEVRSQLESWDSKVHGGPPNAGSRDGTRD